MATKTYSQFREELETEAEASLSTKGLWVGAEHLWLAKGALGLPKNQGGINIFRSYVAVTYAQGVENEALAKRSTIGLEPPVSGLVRNGFGQLL